MVTRFADRDEPSVEDDIIYLAARDGDWLIAKPSATLYRAIGADVPPSVLLRPDGRAPASTELRGSTPTRSAHTHTCEDTTHRPLSDEDR